MTRAAQGWRSSTLRAERMRRVALGAWLEGILAMAAIGTAVTLYPIVKRQQRSMALGYVALRTLEGTMILLGLVALLAVVTLRRDGVGDVAVGQALVAMHDWSFLIGQVSVWGLVLAVPVFAWELNLAFWMVLKGFRPAAGILQPNQAIA